MRRRRASTLLRLKEEARIALRRAVRGGERADECVSRLAERLAPDDEDDLFTLARHTPQLRPDVRANVIAALRRVLEDEAAAIARGGAEYLELQDTKPG